MRIENYLDLGGHLDFSGLFFANGSFGTVDGDVTYEKSENGGVTRYTYEGCGIRLQAEFSITPSGVALRRDTLQNLSGDEITVRSLLSRFTLDGNAYEVYTQYSAWQHESAGAWQPLHTEVAVAAEGIRTCDGAAPMMGLHNLYTQKNTVFHLIPNAQWQMRVRKAPYNDKELTVLECGFSERGLSLRVAAGEVIELPTVVFFDAKSKIDLDAHKLHAWYLSAYPRRPLPIQYNSWLYCFGKLDADKLLRQVDRAAEMGFEAFMIDAGWFGKGERWSQSVGDWVENPNLGLRGRLSEISDRVRARGMIFGLWFEPERAVRNSDAVQAHPEYYIEQSPSTNDFFLDFANPDAVEYMLGVLSEAIERYHIGWLKFDFNASIPIDRTGSAFYRYLQGQRDFILRLRERFPGIRITNCASGGYRMELGQGMLFDSFWLSDNQGPYEGLRIVKDTLKRMPSALIERWNVQKYCEALPIYGSEPTGRMLHCNNGTWDFIIGVKDSFSEAFLQGGPMGFSCDLAAFPPAYEERWAEVIAAYKREREFYRTATARILVDSEGITVIEYADAALARCVLQIFTKTVYARSLRIYPTLQSGLVYTLDGARLRGDEIMEDGILLASLKENECRTITLTAE